MPIYAHESLESLRDAGSNTAGLNDRVKLIRVYMLHLKYSFVIFSGNIFLLSAGQPVQIFPKVPANIYRFASFLQCNFCSDESLHPLANPVVYHSALCSTVYTAQCTLCTVYILYMYIMHSYKAWLEN